MGWNAAEWNGVERGVGQTGRADRQSRRTHDNDGVMMGIRVGGWWEELSTYYGNGKLEGGGWWMEDGSGQAEVIVFISVGCVLLGGIYIYVYRYEMSKPFVYATMCISSQLKRFGSCGGDGLWLGRLSIISDSHYSLLDGISTLGMPIQLLFIMNVG